MHDSQLFIQIQRIPRLLIPSHWWCPTIHTLLIEIRRPNEITTVGNKNAKKKNCIRKRLWTCLQKIPFNRPTKDTHRSCLDSWWNRIWASPLVVDNIDSIDASPFGIFSSPLRWIKRRILARNKRILFYPQRQNSLYHLLLHLDYWQHESQQLHFYWSDMSVWMRRRRDQLDGLGGWSVIINLIRSVVFFS